jgi:hypothetical protein
MMTIVQWVSIEGLICLPNEGFAELIRTGTPVALAAEDIAVLTGRA